MTENLNTTVNGTKLTTFSCSTPVNVIAERIAKTFAYCLILVVSFAGNTIIGIIVYKTNTMRKTINFLIVNMAMSDLVFPILAFPWILIELNIAPWLNSDFLGQALCKGLPALQDISVAVSIQSLVLIAVDRFGAVVFPLRSPVISSKLCPFILLATWITAMILISPLFASLKFVENSACELRWEETFGKTFDFQDYFFTLLLLLYCIPFSVIIILYTSIILKLNFRKHIGEPSTNAEQRRTKRHKNVLKMAIAIVLGFAVCWVPLTTFHFYYFAQGSFIMDRTTRLSCSTIRNLFIARFLAHTSCALNPCVCIIFSAKYRKGLKNLCLNL